MAEAGEKNEMLERVARIMWSAFATEGTYDEDRHDDVPQYLETARLILTAVREPTEAMLAVEKPMCNLGSGPPDYSGSHNSLLKADKEMWQAMIDAALSEDAKK